MIAIPNIPKPKEAVNVEAIFRSSEGYVVGHIFDMPLIGIDEREMEYLYKEFGLEKDENLTDRAKELKRAILMGYLYAKREIVTCGECKHRDPEDKKCDSGMFERQGCIFPVDDDYFCKYGERRAIANKYG